MVAQQEENPDFESFIDKKLKESQKDFAKSDDVKKVNENISHLESHIKDLLDKNSSDQQKEDAPIVHDHATHSGDKFCPDCAKENPEYDEDQATCVNCEKPVGSVKEIENGKIKVCRNCGSDEFESSSKGWTL